MEMKKILKNASYLFLGNITVRFMLAIATILFARYVGPVEYGILSVALAFSGVVCYFTDAGLTHTFMREATKKEANLSELISSYFRIRLILAMVISILTFIFVENFYQDDLMKNIIYWIVFPTMFGATLQGIGNAYFQATERMQFTAGISVLQGVTASFALILGMFFKWPLVFVAAMYGVSSIITGLIALILVLRNTKVHNGWNKSILNQLLSFTINGIIIMMLPQLGPLILEKVSSLSEVGFFATAFKIPAVLYQIPGVIAAAFYPKLFSFGNGGQLNEHRNLSAFELKLMSFIGFGISFPFIANPEYWIVSLLGYEWTRSAEALAILSFMVILQSINYPLADFLTTKGQQTRRTLVMSIGLVVAITLYIILGRQFGMAGGAFAAIITEITLLIGFTISIEKGVSLLLRGLLFNLFGFLASLLIYHTLLAKIYPFPALSLGSIIYALIVITLDRQIRNKVFDVIRQKGILKKRFN
ncbi:sugar translocase [Bacillus sp. V3-13]|uniref:oligosaccharide flippase family protein n=1 Tax=Bacillus sp. V3-13 TaxID=2053728 RepID=UPI000C7730EC|nr:oligosaccharide flippase family protein [Bacillus sp. V3-13]PLR75936.1 sugar translocase [Bacillus sp. V3-13]